MQKERWIVSCVLCGAEVNSYENYLNHLAEKHPGRPEMRFRPHIRKKAAQ